MQGYGWSRLEERASPWHRAWLSFLDGLASLPRPLRFVTGEFLLDRWPNGGGVIALRTIWCAALLFVTAIWLDLIATEGASAAGSMDALRRHLASHLTWFGPLFGAVYAALYSRFSSQWKHLADTYNLIMREWVQEEGRQAGLPEHERVPSTALTTWRQAFIYDAFDLHLARKDNYVSAIEGLLGEREVRRGFSAGFLRPSQRRLLAHLELQAREAAHAADIRLEPLVAGAAPCRSRSRRRSSVADRFSSESDF